MSPVFVIGYPRSGTTLLLHLLMSSGEFPTYRFNESHFFSHCYKRYGSLTSEKNRAALLEELAARDWFSGTDVTAEQLMERLGERKTRYEDYLGTFMGLVAESQGKRRWLEKTPWHFHYIPEIRNAFPNVKFLVMVRDPRDVVVSIAKYGWIENTDDRMLRTALAWRWATRFMRGQFGERSGDHLFVRYEDLARNPDEVLNAINALLGLDLRLSTLNHPEFGVMATSNSSFGGSERGIHTASIGRWRQVMSTDLARRIDHLLEAELRGFGYEVEHSRGLPLAARLELRLMGSAYDTAKRSRRILFPLVRR